MHDSSLLGSTLLSTARRKHHFVYCCVIVGACFDVTDLTWRKFATIHTYCHDLGFDYRRSLDWRIGLLTTCTHHSGLRVITAPLLISKIDRWPQHPLSLFPACCVFNSCSLATASNSEDSSASTRSRRYCPQNIPQLYILVILIVFKITFWRGPYRKNDVLLFLHTCSFLRKRI
jgi:hypothetical protein